MKLGDMVVYQRGKGVDEYIASIVAMPGLLSSKPASDRIVYSPEVYILYWYIH